MSYTISGMEGQDDAWEVIALYNNGVLSLSEQILDDDGAGNVTTLSGLLNGTYISYGWNLNSPNTLFSGQYNHETEAVELTLGKYGSSYTYTKYRFVVYAGFANGEGESLTAYTAAVELPASLTPYKDASSAYTKWIGTWSIPSKEYQYDDEDNYIGDADETGVFEIKQYVADQSYHISGIGPNNIYYDAVAGFDEATGNLVVTPQIYEEWTYQNVLDITESLVGLYGEGEGAMLTWDSSYTLFTASLSGDTATLTPGVSPNGDNFTGFQSYQYYEGGAYGYGGYYVLPNTLTKVDGQGTSSAPKSVKSAAKVKRQADNKVKISYTYSYPVDQNVFKAEKFNGVISSAEILK